MNIALSYYAQNTNVLINTSRDNDGNFLHSHDFVEIVYIMSGRGLHVIEGVGHMISAGDLLLVLPSHEHSIAPVGDETLSFINCAFERDFVDFDLGVFHDDIRVLGSDNIRYRDIFERMLNEYMLREPGYETLIRGYTLVLLVSLMREQDETHTDEPDYKSMRDARLVKKAVAIIDSDTSCTMTEEDVAVYLERSVGHLSRIFKRERGCTLREYMIERRVRVACMLLVTTDLAVDEIASRSGFGSRKAFYVNFRRMTSMSPGEYRARGASF